jgi:hypothetical protein
LKAQDVIVGRWITALSDLAIARGFDLTREKDLAAAQKSFTEIERT